MSQVIPLGIVFNGATGELARKHHLPGLVAMGREGGLPLANGGRVVPDVILVGRSESKLRDTSAETGFARWTTDLDAALAEPGISICFDAAPSGMRVGVVRKAIAAGKHVYVEKPIAGSLDDALAISREAVAAGLKNGTVQDKLFLPGFAALLGLSRSGFFGRLLEVRVEMGRWVFDGETTPGQRPSWNYRSRDGGGLILDMFPHWRYMLDALAGEVTAVSATCRTQIPSRRDEAGQPYPVDVDDSVFASLELASGAIASVNCSWATRVRREFPIQVQIDGTDGSAVAGPFGCWSQRADHAPAGPLASAIPGNPRFFDNWDAVPLAQTYTGSYRAGWELFIRHVLEDAPFPYSLMEGAKGVQLAELAYRSNRERRWIDVPKLG
ncbi:Gfo/Idh/MocA family protein [uncultured Enterovirga sp.]|uniref:Gfo/Idh/MocA family protein n=1 Tax=uncultured Enterovirga sp. TaxID=2026352 RepID=UPI0035CB6A51